MSIETRSYEAWLPSRGSWQTGKELMATLVLSTILLIAADGKQVERCRCATRCREAKPGWKKTGH